MRPQLALAVFAISACRRHAAPPVPEIEHAAALPSPVSTPCASRPLVFRPLVGKRYRFTADEGRKHYVSEVVFTAASGAWSADERNFAIPFTPWTSKQDPTEAALHWTLQSTGVPAAHPTSPDHSDTFFMEALSLFRFRTAITLPSTCVGDTHDDAWTELGRPRSISTKVLSVDDQRVRLHVTIKRGEWNQDGEVDVSLYDGLTGEARLHELGPGAPAVNDTQRVIEITHE